MPGANRLRERSGPKFPAVVDRDVPRHKFSRSSGTTDGVKGSFAYMVFETERSADMSASRFVAIMMGSALIAFGVSQLRAAPPRIPAAEEFINRAGIAGIFEVRAARLALERAQNPELRAFAATMIHDHTDTGEELRKVAGDFPVPTALDSEHQALIDELNAASSTTFDATYWKQLVDAHKEAVSLFTLFSTEGENGAIKGFAAKTLPMLQKHQDMLGRLAKVVDPESSGAPPAP